MFIPDEAHVWISSYFCSVITVYLFIFFGLVMPTPLVNTYIFIKIMKTKKVSVFDASIG